MLPNRWAKRLKTQESVQRSLCRLGFLLLAVLPTLVISCGWLWSITPWSRSWTVRSWERLISLNAGVDVHLASVEYYAPNSYRFREVDLKHPETGDLIASIPSIEFQRGPAAWILRLQSPVVHLSQASNLAHFIHERYLCQPNLAFPAMTCSLRGLTMIEESGAMEPVYLESRFECDKDKSALQTRFDFAKNLANGDGSRSASFAVERIHDAIAPRTNWMLETHDLVIPVPVLAAFQSMAAQLGPEATFQGDIHWKQDALGWHAAMAGLFQKVRWIHAEVGRGQPSQKSEQIRVDFAQVFNGRLLQAQGLVTAESGGESELSQWLALALEPTPSVVQAASHVDSTGRPLEASPSIQR